MRVGTGTPGAFSPDGRWVIAMTRQLSGPPQLLLIPVGPGATRQLTSDNAAYTEPSFAGPETILFGRSQAGTSEIWSMALD